MSLIRRRPWLAGFILGLGPVSSPSAWSQDLPPVFPPSGNAAELAPGTGIVPPAPAVVPGPGTAASLAPSPIVRPLPPIVAVPPQGVGPVWGPAPIDPVALQRKDRPHHFDFKTHSWHWRRLQGKMLGYPEAYEPRPLGAALYEHGKIMVANGAAARLVLYQYDFVQGSSELTPRGLDQLAKFTAQLAASPYPLLVERTPDDPGLAERRRYAVLAKLAVSPSPLSSERVLIGVPTPHGMSGIDAYIIGNNSLSRTQAYGPPIPLQSNGVNSPSGVTNNIGASGGASFP